MDDALEKRFTALWTWLAGRFITVSGILYRRCVLGGGLRRP